MRQLHKQVGSLSGREKSVVLCIFLADFLFVLVFIRSLSTPFSSSSFSSPPSSSSFLFKAAAAIFEARNQQGQRSDLLDLHGLHVEEGLSYLEWWLDELHREARHQVCYVVTGTGHHSNHRHLAPGKQARLLPAVTRYLQDNGYR